MVNIDVVETVNYLVGNCKQCDLHKNGTAIPYIGSNPKAIILGEAPGKNEVIDGEPFVGKSGKYLFEVFNKNGFDRSNFIIINTTQCRPVKKTKTGETNGKPSKGQIQTCMPFVYSVLFNSGLYDIIGLGNYPKYWVDAYKWKPKERIGGIFSIAGTSINIEALHSSGLIKRFTYCYHPASVIYDSKKKSRFEETIKEFCEKVKYKLPWEGA